MRQYIDLLSDLQGNALFGATCKVTNYVGGGNAALFSDNGLTPIALSTVSTDITGQYSFFVADGDYTLTISVQGSVYKILSPVSIFDGAAQVTQADTGGAANVYATSSSVLEKVLRTGLRSWIKIANTNNGLAAPTYAYNGLAAKPIIGFDGTVPSSGVLVANGIYSLEYNGAAWQLAASFLSPSSIGTQLYPPSAAEISTGVTVVNAQYPYNNLLRYGIVPNLLASAAANTAILKTLTNYLVTGPVGRIWSPNITGADTYYFSDIIPLRDGTHLDGENTTWSFTKVGGPGQSDSDCGFLYGIRDITIENMTIVANYSQSGSAWVNAGDCIALGTRGDSPFFQPGFDALMASRQGNCTIRKVHLVCNHAIGNPIYMLGGLQNCTFEDISMDGGGVAVLGLYYEFGWATNEADRSARQTSHANNMRLRNISGKNFSTTAVLVTFNGAYGITVDGLYAANMASAFGSGSGESLFYRPWTGVDDAGAKRNIVLRNITGEGLLATGISVGGKNAPTGGYLGGAWVALTNYILGATRINGGNWYVVTTPGLSGNTGGPTGTGTGIADGTVVWDFIPLANEVDLAEFTLDGFALVAPTGAVSTGAGVRTSAGHASIRNGTCINHSVGVVTDTECTRYTIEGVRCLNSLAQGMELGLIANIYSPGRLAVGIVRDCFIAGSGVSGGQPGILVNAQHISSLIENNRIGYETAHDGIAETTQTFAVRVLNSTNAGVICRGNYVGGVSGGATAYRNDMATPLGMKIEKAQGLATVTGLWLSDSPTGIFAQTPGSGIAFAPDCQYGNWQICTQANAAAFNVNAPLNPPVIGGFQLTVTIKNTSGGALGVATFNAIYKMAAWVQPANTFSASIDFEWNGTNWVEVGRGGVTVPN